MSSNELAGLSRCFNIWREYLRDAREKREYLQILQEELEELEYASENNLESVYWCWNCKYSECERHSIVWEREYLD